MRLRTRALGVAVALSFATCSIAKADVEAAKKYVEEAKHELEMKSYNDAKSKLELAEAELEDAPAAAKTAVSASIAEVKAQIAASTIADNKIKYTRELGLIMTEAEGSIGNLVTWTGVEQRFNDLANNPDAAAALGADLTAAQKKFSTFKKLNDRKVLAAKKEQVETSVKEFEAAWAEAKPKILKPETPGDKDSAISDMDRKLEDVRRTVAQLSVETEPGKGFSARVEQIGTEYMKLALADQVKEKVERLQRDWNSYKDDWNGWEAETTGPTFAEYSKESSESMSALKAPKTRQFISRSNYWLKNRDEDEEFKKLHTAPELQAMLAKITADRDVARGKMEKFADALLADAEKQTLDQDKVDTLKRFEDSLKNNVEGSPKFESLDGRAFALINKFENQGKAAEVAAAAYYKAMTEKASTNWPDLKARYTIATGFDPSNAADFKGKYIAITTDNLMGYRFGPGDFPFATTLNGVPIAAKYDPAVAAAINEIQTKIGRSLGDNDDDGKWEIIAVVDGTTGKLNQRLNVEGKIKDTAGNEATVTGEKHEAADAPIITIVAAHCGPLAVSSK